MTAVAAPAIAYSDARLYGVLITAALALLGSGSLVPWFNRRTVRRLEREPSLSARQATKLKAANLRQNNPVLGVFLGRDGRLSTSTTIAFFWTLVISWIIASLVVAWPADWDAALKHLNATYFALLGGPYAAWALARVAVSAKVENQTLQKPSGDGTIRLSDLLSGDDGNPDLFDIQYVTFNLLAMAFVIAAFIHASQNGFTGIPWGLLFLTGGPAAVYASNKAFSGNAPVIFSVSPRVLNAGAALTVYGQNFAPTASGVSAVPSASGATPPQDAPAATPAKLRVQVGGVECPDPDLAYDSVVRTTAPALDYDLTPQDVVVLTAVGAQAILRAQVVVHNTPRLLGISPPTTPQTGTVTITGRWHDPAQAGLALLIGQAGAVSPLAGASTTSAQFVLPNLGIAAGSSRDLPITLSQYGLVSEPKTITVNGTAP